MFGLTETDLPMLLVVSLVIAVVWLIRRWGPYPSKDPAKIARWKALPLRFKFVCWFGVCPLFALSIVLPFWLHGLAALVSWVLLFATALVCMSILEGRVVAWYKANGLLPTYDHEGKLP